jgi:hypothetical protein
MERWAGGKQGRGTGGEASEGQGGIGIFILLLLVEIKREACEGVSACGFCAAGVTDRASM